MTAQALWDRHLAAAEAIVRSAKPLTPTRPSSGDRSLPPCRPGQWRVIWPGEHGFAGAQRFFLSGGLQPSRLAPWP
jgi:sarcosine oxidase gamma subunit